MIYKGVSSTAFKKYLKNRILSGQAFNIYIWYKLMLLKFDCSSKKIRIIRIIVYNKDGRVFGTYRENEYLAEMDYVPHKTIGEEFWKCFVKNTNFRQ